MKSKESEEDDAAVRQLLDTMAALDASFLRVQAKFTRLKRPAHFEAKLTRVKRELDEINSRIYLLECFSLSEPDSFTNCLHQAKVRFLRSQMCLFTCLFVIPQ